MRTPPDIMTLEEVARYLRLSVQTVYKKAQHGEIPAAKIGKEWRFRRSILDEWLDASIISSQAGMDLVVQQTWLAARRRGLASDQIERIVSEALREEDDGGAGAARGGEASS